MSDWPNYLIRTDFTARGAQLAQIPLGPLDDSDQRFIAAVLADDTDPANKDKWNLDPASTEFSLNGVEVVFNGLNKQSLPTFSFFKYALGLKFPERSTAPVGSIYMCWYEPDTKSHDVNDIDPPAVIPADESTDKEE